MSLASARMLRRISPCRPNAICLFPPAWLWLHIPRCALGGMQRQYSTERPDPVLKPGTLYQMLGVTRVASQEDVKSRWYDLARQYHPDVNPGGRITFERAKRAYETLGDRAKRKAYDHKLDKASASAKAKAKPAPTKPPASATNPPTQPHEQTAPSTPPPTHPEPSRRPTPPPSHPQTSSPRSSWSRRSIYASLTSGPRSAPRPRARPSPPPRPQQSASSIPKIMDRLRGKIGPRELAQHAATICYDMSPPFNTRDDPPQMFVSDPRWLEPRFADARASIFLAMMMHCQPRLKDRANFASAKEYNDLGTQTLKGIADVFKWPMPAQLFKQTPQDDVSRIRRGIRRANGKILDTWRALPRKSRRLVQNAITLLLFIWMLQGTLTGIKRSMTEEEEEQEAR